MESLLVIGSPVVALAACWWAFRSIRRRQQRGELTNLPPRTYGDLMLPGYDPTESAAAENYIEQIDHNDRPGDGRSHRLDDH